MKAGQRQPFAHRHEEMEEIYVVISGTGRVKLDDEVEDVRPARRDPDLPRGVRAFEAGDEDLELLAFSPGRRATRRSSRTSPGTSVRFRF